MLSRTALLGRASFLPHSVSLSHSLLLSVLKRYARTITPQVTKPLPIPPLPGSPFPADLSNPNAIPNIPLIFKPKPKVVDPKTGEIIDEDDANLADIQKLFVRRKKIIHTPFDWKTTNHPTLDKQEVENFSPTLFRPFPWIRITQPEAQSCKPDVKSKRTGLIGIKCGMMSLYDKHGVKFAVSVVRIDSQVTHHRHTLDSNGCVGLQLGAGKHKLKRLTKIEMTQFKKAGVYPKAHLKEFAVTPDAMLPLGYTLNASHFKPGQYVDVTGTSIGKGHAGGMKRWNFGGTAKTHGTSLTHRALGSTGQNQEPGKVWKGKKMSGQLGNEKITTLNLQIYKVDPARNLLFIRGSIPGNKDNYLYIRDAIKKHLTAEQKAELPFPTAIIKPGHTFDESDLIHDVGDVDPFSFGSV